MTTLLNDDVLQKALSDEGLLKIKTIVRLKKLLQREKKGFLGVLHARTGVGLTVAEFSTIVRGLVNEGWCSLKEGRQGGITVVFNETFTAVNVPELMTEPDQHNEKR